MKADFFYSRSGNSLRAALAIELSQIEVNKHYIDLSQEEHKTDTFLKINAAGTVPVYAEYSNGNESDVLLTQSGAIMEYLVSLRRPDLIPQDIKRRAQVQSSVLVALSDIAIQNALMRYMNFHAENESFLRNRLLGAISAAFLPIRSTSFFGGIAPNIEDFAHFPVIFMREALLRKTGEYAHILDWLGRMNAIPEVSSSVEYAGLQL